MPMRPKKSTKSSSRYVAWYPASSDSHLSQATPLAIPSPRASDPPPTRQILLPCGTGGGGGAGCVHGTCHPVLCGAKSAGVAGARGSCSTSSTSAASTTRPPRSTPRTTPCCWPAAGGQRQALRLEANDRLVLQPSQSHGGAGGSRRPATVQLGKIRRPAGPWEAGRERKGPTCQVYR